MCPTVLLAVVEVGGGTEFLPAFCFSEFGLVDPASEQDSILSQEKTQGWVCFVDNRHDRLSSLRRITWFIPGLIMVIQKENMFVSVIDGRTSLLVRTFYESSIAPGNDCNQEWSYHRCGSNRLHLKNTRPTI